MYEPSLPLERMMPVVSAFETDPGVMLTTASSDVVVWSPAPSRITGWRLFTPTPLQSVTWILTGRTWPFFSLFVTGVFVTGGRKAPVPTDTVAVAGAEFARSLSLIVTVAVWLQPADAQACVCGPKL